MAMAEWWVAKPKPCHRCATKAMSQRDRTACCAYQPLQQVESGPVADRLLRNMPVTVDEKVRFLVFGGLDGFTLLQK